MSYSGKRRLVAGAGRGNLTKGFKVRDCDRCHLDLTPEVTYAGTMGPTRARMPKHLEVTFHTVGSGGERHGPLPHPATLHLCAACARVAGDRWSVLLDQLMSTPTPTPSK